MENAYAVSRFLLSGSGGQGVITMAILLAEGGVKYERQAPLPCNHNSTGLKRAAGPRVRT